ncbi:MAG TPA: PD-(D/E)XK nuclease family protein, partial [Gaiellaceae bacterium]|nr:PD-(D/E)XK nuclease family protein [Gaiellaceae bacterium]
FGQQQVADLLAYLRLLHNRYDDEAVVSVLASPFVGVSNDALVLIRRAAPRRPLYTPFERGLPESLPAADRQLCLAFKQRYERLAALAPSLSLERLCDEIVARHDYDLAVLAQWDGRRRYANLRKLARLARSFEDLRGPDLESFIRFVSDQEAVGARELEAAAEEEGADVVRLLTIHAAKGLEFKVVIVADAGRDRAQPSSEEILVLPDGRFGFRVADPATGERKPALDYAAVREAEQLEEEAERLRLYYVAMTRAIDRLIVSGAIDPEKAADRRTPIGWVLARLEPKELEQAEEAPVELVRDGARLLVRVDRFRDEPAAVGAPEPDTEAGEGQLALFAELAEVPPLPPPAPRLPALEPLPAPPVHEVRKLSFTALSSFERCSYRYYAERVAGMAPREHDAGGEGLAATSVGSAVHALLEHMDLGAPAVPADLAERVRGDYPGASDAELERIRGFVQAYCDSELATRIAALEGVAVERHFTFEHDGVLLHGFLDVHHVEGGRALVLDYKTNALGEHSPEEVVDAEYGLQRLVYALACFRAGADEVEVVYAFLERPDAVVSAAFERGRVPELEAELSAAIARLRAGDFRPTPSEFACSGCPALDVVCAGPRLRGF